MDAIKQAVTQTLEKQGIIAQLKAQLRAQVFIAVDEYESTSSGSGLASKTDVPARRQLLADPDGQLVLQLILDLLDTCNLAFTKKVFQPEVGPNAPEGGRQAAISKLGLKPASADEPLLLTLVKAFKSGATARVTNSGPTTPAAIPPPAAPSAAPAPVPAAPTSSSSPPSAPTAAPASAAPASASAPRSTISAAPLPRLEPLAPISKPALAPLPSLGSSAGKSIDAPLAPVSMSGLGPTKTVSSDPPAAAKPAAEASAESAYSSEVFEEEPVEEVEDDAAGSAGDDDDDDYATALGFKPSASGVPKPDLGRAGSSGGEDSDSGRKERLGGGFPSSSRGRAALDPDLMAGDRSFGVSNELAGLDAGNSGGLSFSADYGSPGDPRASVSSSQAMLSPLSEGGPKVSKLEPLRPLGAKLSPLGPLPTIGTLSSSLSSSKEDPLAKGPKALAPLGPPVRKSLPDIEKEKEELRRLGLLQSGESLSASMEVEMRRPNIYDAEMSVSASMDDGAWSGGIGGSSSGARELPHGNKNLSMDLRETGLSASDRSGDIEQMGADLAETAEWH